MSANSSPTTRPAADRYRLVVLGGGPAGLAAAREAARRGARVALVLPEVADPQPPPVTPLAEQIRRAQTRFGMTGRQQPPDLPEIDVLHAQAVFSGLRTVMVGGREIRFRRALIATGTTATPVEIHGADQNDCLRPETLDNLTELPRRLAVIGSGGGACQWAQFFCRAGSEVHLIGRHDTILPGEDPEAVAVIRDQLEQDGVRLRLSRDRLAIETTGNLHGVLMERDGVKEKLLVDRVLLCSRRQPNVDGLRLETAGVVCTGEGLIVGRCLQTTNRRIFAAGGACGLYWASLPAAQTSGRRAGQNATGYLKRRFRREIIPRCIYTDPMLAQVGLTQEEKTAREIEIDTFRVELSEGNEAIAESRRRGFISVDVHRHTGRIAGATVVAEDADELIAPLVVLMTQRRSLVALAGVTACHPSRFELLVRLADAYSATRRRLRSRTIARCRAWWRRKMHSDRSARPVGFCGGPLL